ncbi:MAG: hypothetical protein ACXWDQ_04380 [Solirubrobacterales bacterium]
MNERDWRKLGAATGLGFVVLLVLSFIVGPTDPPAFNDPALKVSAYVADNQDEIDSASALILGALAFFAFFIGAVAANNRRNEKDGRLSATAHAGGIVAIAVAVGGTAVAGAAAAAQGSGATPDLVKALWNMQALGFAAGGIGTAILIYATGVLALRSDSLPRWLGIGSVMIGVFQAAVAIIAMTQRDGAFSPYDGALPQVSLLVLGLWVLATSVVLIDRAASKK